MLKHLLAPAFFILIALGCKERPEQNKGVLQSKTTTQSSDFEEAIQLILDVPEFQMWLHGEAPERVPLKLVRNEFVKGEYELEKFGERVRIVDSATIKKEQIPDAIRIKRLNSAKDTVQFSLYHPIEGAVMQGRLYKRNKQWQIIVDRIGER